MKLFSLSQLEVPPSSSSLSEVSRSVIFSSHVEVDSNRGQFGCVGLIEICTSSSIVLDILDVSVSSNLCCPNSSLLNGGVERNEAVIFCCLNCLFLTFAVCFHEKTECVF